MNNVSLQATNTELHSEACQRHLLNDHGADEAEDWHTSQCAHSGPTQRRVHGYSERVPGNWLI